MFAAESKLCCIITGASRGFGVSLSSAVARQSYKSGNSVTFILTARSSSGLEKTKSIVNGIFSSAKVHCVSEDIHNSEELPTSLSNILGKVDPKEFTHVLFINNAATIGDASKKLKDLDSPQEIQQHCDMNIVAPMFLASRFLNVFHCVPKKYIVNISSLAAISEMVGMSLYCTGKAAGDMIFRSISKEEPDVRVLNYAPGPLETDMFQYLVENSLEPAFKTMKPLKPDDSSSKLMKLLLEDKFESGSHIDYYDIE